MQKNYWLSWNKKDPYSNKNYVWYYLGKDGAMYAAQWLKDLSDNKWYYFDGNGIMVRNLLVPYNGGYSAIGGDGACVLNGTANVNVKVKDWLVQF
jgi:glucan-binding YG repeat protein